MTFYERLEAQFLADPTLGPLISDRMSPALPTGLPRETALPAVTYQRVAGGAPWYTHAGPAAMNVSRLQFNCYADSVIEAQALADAVAGAANSFREQVFVMGQRDIADPETRTSFPIVEAMFYHE